MPAVIAAQFKGLQWPMGLNANLIFYWPWQLNLLFIPLANSHGCFKIKCKFASEQQTRQLGGVVYHSAWTSVSFGRDDGGQLAARKSMADNQGVDIGLDQF